MDQSDDAYVATAAQLVYAYTEASSADDEEYAADAIADFLLDEGEQLPSEALIALLGLPEGDLTTPLLDQVHARLVERGPAVVEALLVTGLGASADAPDVREALSPVGAVDTFLRAVFVDADDELVAGGALQVLGEMDERDLVQGLIEVLAGGARDAVKEAAVNALAALGSSTEAELRMACGDPDARPWAARALEAMGATRPAGDASDPRFDAVREAIDEDEADEDETGEEAVDEAADDAGESNGAQESDDGGIADAGDTGVEADGAPLTAASPGAPAETPGVTPPVPPSLPGTDAIKADFDAFRERFERETGD